MNSGTRTSMSRGAAERLVVLYDKSGQDPYTYAETLCFLFFLKLIDEEEEKRKQFYRISRAGKKVYPSDIFPGQAERFRWSRWRDKHGAELLSFVRDEVIFYMASLVREDPFTASYFKDARLDILHPFLLDQLVEAVDTIGFLPLGNKKESQILEGILDQISIDAREGVYRTPSHIRKIMVEMLDPRLGQTICDPTCGTGSILTGSIRHIADNMTRKSRIENLNEETDNFFRILENSIYGYDISRQMTRIAIMNLILHGIRHPRIKRANVLSDSGGLSQNDLERRFDLIMSDPPKGGMISDHDIRHRLPLTTRKSDLLFLSAQMNSLETDGVCATIVPYELLGQNSAAHIELRKNLLANFNVLAIVILPMGFLTPIPRLRPVILVFKRGPSDHVWYYEFKEATPGINTTTRYTVDRRTFDRFKQAEGTSDLLKYWQGYANTNYRQAPGAEGGEFLPFGSKEVQSWWVSVDKIARKNFDLDPKLYKPKVMEEKQVDDPKKLINEVLRDERDIRNLLEKLMEEIRYFNDI